MQVDSVRPLRLYIYGTSLVVLWLRLRAPNSGGSGLIPGQETRSHMMQLKVPLLQLKTPHTTVKIKGPKRHS